MPRRLVKAYTRSRLLNINVNLIASGLLAIALAKIPVYWLSPSVRSLAANFGVDPKLLVTIVATAIDGVVDILLYYGLHWLANHSWRPRRAPKPIEHAAPVQTQTQPHDEAAAAAHVQAVLAAVPRRSVPRRSFFWDATHVQFGRIMLSPVYYGTSMPIMYVLMLAGLRDSWAFAFAFAAGILVTRVVHTLWGLRTGLFTPDHHDDDRKGGHEHATRPKLPHVHAPAEASTTGAATQNGVQLGNQPEAHGGAQPGARPGAIRGSTPAQTIASGATGPGTEDV